MASRSFLERVGLGVLAVVGTGFVLGAAGLWTVQTAQERTHALSKEHLREGKLLTGILVEVQSIGIESAHFSMSRDKRELEKALAGLDRLEVLVSQSRKDLGFETLRTGDLLRALDNTVVSWRKLLVELGEDSQRLDELARQGLAARRDLKVIEGIAESGSLEERERALRVLSTIREIESARESLKAPGDVLPLAEALGRIPDARTALAQLDHGTELDGVLATNVDVLPSLKGIFLKHHETERRLSSLADTVPSLVEEVRRLEVDRTDEYVAELNTFLGVADRMLSIGLIGLVTLSLIASWILVRYVRDTINGLVDRVRLVSRDSHSKAEMVESLSKQVEEAFDTKSSLLLDLAYVVDEAAYDSGAVDKSTRRMNDLTSECVDLTREVFGMLQALQHGEATAEEISTLIDDRLEELEEVSVKLQKEIGDSRRLAIEQHLDLESLRYKVEHLLESVRATAERSEDLSEISGRLSDHTEVIEDSMEKILKTLGADVQGAEKLEEPVRKMKTESVEHLLPRTLPNVGEFHRRPKD